MSRADDRTPYVERELTLAVPDGTPVPHLAGVPRVRVGEPVVHELRATYYDTPTYALLRRGLTLRRRTGGDDAGWHLKVPTVVGDGDGGLVARAEHHRPDEPDRFDVPADLRRLVASLVLDEPLGAVAVLETHRVEVPLLDDAGRRWATLTDDGVTAHRERARHGDDLPVVRWREWEVELVAGTDDEGRLADVVATLRAAGATDPPSASKLRRALGDLALPQPWTGRPRSAHELAALRIGDLVERLRVEDVGWRAASGSSSGVDGASVHRFRTTVRRLRSVLQTFGPVLDPGREDDPDGPVGRAQAELRWLGGELGEHRDAEVMAERLHAQLREAAGPDLPPGTTDELHALVDEVVGARRDEAARRVDRALDAERYRALLAALDELAVPPRPDDPDHPDDAAVRHDVARLVRHDLRRLRRAVAAADAGPPGEEHDVALHEVRKRAKRLRYAADTARPVLGRGARRLARRARAVQEALGDHQDAVVAREAVRSLLPHVARRPALASPEAAASAGFVLGRLDAVQVAAARAAESVYGVARARLPRHPRRLLGA